MTVAASAGYCFGVRRAVETALAAAPAFTLGPLIHNKSAVKELELKGVTPVDAEGDIPAGARVVIRSHGVTRRVFERLSARCAVTDATCPFVKAIHRMAEECPETVPVIIAGQREHPEVEGILGWCRGRAYVISSPNEALRLPQMPRAMVVSQTTMDTQVYADICKALKERIAKPDIRNTVCSATSVRQREARSLAAKSDVMLIVGDRQSANTFRLYEIAKSVCPRSYLIEGAAELNDIKINKTDLIGITAGASTPCCKYKEVVARMNDIENKVIDQITAAEADESDFASQFEKTMVQIRPGQTVTGKVLLITEDEVCVSIGYKSDGLIKKSDLCDTDVKVGDEIEVEVVKVNDGEGNVLLSQRNIVDRKNWDEIVAKNENGEYITAVGKEAVKGGLLCSVNGIRAFVPASQLSRRYVDKIEQFVGQELKLKIIELDRAKKRIVASRKAVIEEEAAARKQEIWSKLEEGAIVKGTVRRLTDFGAFVDVGGVDGLVHVTNLCWGHIDHPSKVVKVGDVIDVKIMSLDPEKERISLSRKEILPRPWTVAEEKYPVDSIVTGTVVRITPFGAFVELESGLDGLIHISQCATTRIAKVEDALSVGQEVRVKVLSVDTENKRISLSVRAVLEEEALENVEAAEEYAIDEPQENA